MPRFDKTGPMGMGPRTGRGLGPCCGFCGCGGYGRFWRMSKEERREILKEESEYLKEELQEIEKELAELKE